jgi:hypothetical protein
VRVAQLSGSAQARPPPPVGAEKQAQRMAEHFVAVGRQLGHCSVIISSDWVKAAVLDAAALVRAQNARGAAPILTG